MKPWQVFLLIVGVALLGIAGYFATHNTTYSSPTGVIDCGSVLSKKDAPLLDVSFNGFFIQELNNSSCADARGKEQTKAIGFGIAAVAAITIALFGPKMRAAASQPSSVVEPGQHNVSDESTATEQ